MHMKITRIARNVILAGMAWRLIAWRRDALARERRARRIARLLITAGGAGVILAARPRILEGARRLWDVARRHWNGETSNAVREPQRDVEKAPLADREGLLRHEGKPASGGPETTSNSRAVAEAEPKAGVKKGRKRVARAKQSEKSTPQSAHGVRVEGEERSEPGTELGDSLKH
jgi:hypothetical protein